MRNGSAGPPSQRGTIGGAGRTLIKQKLLSIDSLMPGIEKPPGEGPVALDKALRALVCYRFITQSHCATTWITTVTSCES